MSDIRYVCLSDLHLGGQSSLLTRLGRHGDVKAEGPVLDALAAGLRDLIDRVHTGPKPPALVLNGDTLELALAEPQIALMAFERFLQRLFPPGRPLFGRIVYVPGNHDHHLWETAREEQYRRHVARVARDVALDEPWHTTKLFTRPAERPEQKLLGAAARRVGTLGPAATIRTVYPNFGVIQCGADPGRRCVVFHHGHFIEPAYRLVSTVLRALFPEAPPIENIYQLEEENFAWIDFLWSALGRSGAAGDGVAAIYNSRCDAAKLKALLGHLARVIARHYLRSGLPDWAEERILRWIFRVAADQIAKLERHRTGPALSRTARRGLKDYVEQLLHDQMQTEQPPGATMPARLTFVFGHTHKPLAANIGFDGFDGLSAVYNTGGWVVDTPTASPQRGAAMVLVDAELNVANVRLFQEGRYDVRVEQAARAEDTTGFAEAVGRHVRPDRPVWKAFGSVVKKEINVRRRRFKSGG